MFRRRSSHKPSEAFLNAFKDRYGNTAPAEQGASPAVTPFLLGPPPPGAAPSALTDSTYACPASTSPRNEVSAPAHHVAEDVHHSDTFTSSHNLDDDEQRFDNSQFDLGGYHKHHFMEDQLFDLDPNGLDFTFGGGWAPSPHGQLSLPRQLSSATALAGASSLGTPTSIGLSESATAAHFIKHTLSNHTAFNTFGVLQHMGPVQDPYQPSLEFLSSIQSFNPQDSMLQQHQQHQQEGNGMVSAPAFPMTGSFNFPPALRDHIARPSTRSEREQEQFRFRVKLMAPTAMVAHEDDHPITYLNKRQPYTITITDTRPPVTAQNIQYRTSIRVSFDDEPQRAKPSSSWQLFREGRGQSEADERGSPELRAIEWVSPDQGSGTTSRGTAQKPHQEFFDGFSVHWTSGHQATGVSEISLQLRCNFLSTDFSHSKGVKGIPVRLCCKTEIISPHLASETEICYCKVKTFRDHGAERKLNNDRTHVEKNIDKLVRELEQSSASGDLNDSGKRRHSDSIISKGPPSKKLRTTSVSSGSPDVDEVDGQLEEKIRMLRTKMASGRDQSLLYLRGEEGDDPDMHPPGLLEDTGMSTLQPASLRHFSSSSTQRSVNSPVSSSKSMPREWQQDTASARSYLPTPAPGVSRNPSAGDVAQTSPRATSKESAQPSNPQHLASPPQGLSKVKRPRPNADGSVREWIDVMGTDQGYLPPQVPGETAVACFYIKPTVSSISLGDDYFRAVYLKRRDCQEFVNAVCSKCGINPSNVVEVLRPQASGQYVKVEDDTILHLKEGQDMLCDFQLLDRKAPSFDADGEKSEQYRLKLMF